MTHATACSGRARCPPSLPCWKPCSTRSRTSSRRAMSTSAGTRSRRTPNSAPPLAQQLMAQEGPTLCLRSKAMTSRLKAIFLKACAPGCAACRPASGASNLPCPHACFSDLVFRRLGAMAEAAWTHRDWQRFARQVRLHRQRVIPMRIAICGRDTECSTSSPVLMQPDDFRELRDDALTADPDFGLFAFPPWIGPMDLPRSLSQRPR